LGISRLFGSWVKDNTHVTMATGDIFITVQEPHYVHHYVALADQWRHHGWRVETCLESWPLAKQMKYANKKGYLIAIMANEEDILKEQVVMKHMTSGEQITASLSQAPGFLKQWLVSPGSP
jgi:histidyl-tRNA synthetase